MERKGKHHGEARSLIKTGAAETVAGEFGLTERVGTYARTSASVLPVCTDFCTPPWAEVSLEKPLPPPVGEKIALSCPGFPLLRGKHVIVG